MHTYVVLCKMVVDWGTVTVVRYFTTRGMFLVGSRLRLGNLRADAESAGSISRRPVDAYGRRA